MSLCGFCLTSKNLITEHTFVYVPTGTGKDMSMINYFFLEYFRNLSGLSSTQLSAACGKASDRSYYSHHLKKRFDFPPEQIQTMAEVLEIVPEWITQSPVVLTKQDLDSYIEQNEQNEFVPLVHRTDKSNQYIIDSPGAVSLLNDFSEKLRCISLTSVSTGSVSGNATYIEDYAALIRQSFMPDPDYVPMSLRPVLEFADTHYKDHIAFVKAFVSQYREIIPELSETMLLRKLATAKTIPSTTVNTKIIQCFADFANVSQDRAFCDFCLSSNESVFNLFLATSITLSGWTLYEDNKSGDMLLTLTNPKFLPNAKPFISDQISDYMPQDFSF